MLVRVGRVIVRAQWLAMIGICLHVAPLGLAANAS